MFWDRLWLGLSGVLFFLLDMGFLSLASSPALSGAASSFIGRSSFGIDARGDTTMFAYSKPVLLVLLLAF